MILTAEHVIQSNWYLITIDDPDFLPSINFIRMIKYIKEMKKFNYVILNDLEATGRYGLVDSLQKRQNTPIDLNELIEKIVGVKQFEWGDFFLFTDFPKNWNNSGDGFYPHLIVQSETTLRAIDGQYIYIYTPYKEIVDLVKENYAIESVKYDVLDNLDYPY